MKAKIFVILAVFILNLFMASCGDNNSHKMDVEKYRENLRKSGEKNSISPEEREKTLKKLFPNYKPKQD